MGIKKLKLIAKLAKKEKQLRKLRKKTLNFLSAFCIVFENDWQHTLSCLQNNATCFIEQGQNFVTPHKTYNEHEEYNNWHNRPALLRSFRGLRKFMKNSKFYKNAQVFKNSDWCLI